VTTITVQATYQDGVLKPQAKLDLPENAVVEVQITPLRLAHDAPGSLFGAFPELGALTGEDFAWAERLWEHSVEEQPRILDTPE